SPAESGLELGKLSQSTPDDALIHFRLRGPDGRILQVEDFPVRRGAEGWSQPVSAQTVTAYRTTFNYLPPAQRRLLIQPSPSR
ncbi:MAG: hypothetical protein NTV51_19860, partial [Verrucomicrobia bacterium]|nr:hypothetical protein [Verrucomicrobiota bacterium]